MTLDAPNPSNPDLANPSPSNEGTAAQPQTRQDAKRVLRQQLATHEGNPSHPDVAEAIATLAAYNPIPDPATADEQLEGNWALISAPSFPDGERRSDGSYVYTLGRLAFNMFQPSDLKVVINQVFQPVWPIGDGELHSHDIVVHFTTLSDDLPPLRGIVRNLAICRPKEATVLQVQFTGGTLEPAEGENLQQWMKVFGSAFGSEPTSSLPLQDRLKQWLQGLPLQLLFGLVPPDSIDPKTGQVEFQMKRSPKGNLTLLYLDEELRITRGNKETVLVCERC